MYLNADLLHDFKKEVTYSAAWQRKYAASLGDKRLVSGIQRVAGSSELALITGFGSELSRLCQSWAHLQLSNLITVVKRRNPSGQECCSDVS